MYEIRNIEVNADKFMMAVLGRFIDINSLPQYS
jgi:hypothetical protein